MTSASSDLGDAINAKKIMERDREAALPRNFLPREIDYITLTLGPVL